MSKNSTLRGLIEDKNSNHSSTSIKSSNDSNNLLQHSGKYIEKVNTLFNIDSLFVSHFNI